MVWVAHYGGDASDGFVCLWGLSARVLSRRQRRRWIQERRGRVRRRVAATDGHTIWRRTIPVRLC